MTQERRDLPRVSTENVRALYVEVQTEGMMVPGAVVPEDVSMSGIRGRWERPLPEDVDFTLRLEVLEGAVQLKARVAWQKLLPGRGTLAGLTFKRVSARTRERLRVWLERLQAPSRRQVPRVADILPVEVILPVEDESFAAIATDLGAEGIQITNDFALDEERLVELLLPLGWGVPVDVQARVRWRKKTPGGGWLMGLQFEAPSATASEQIRGYLQARTTAVE